MQLHSTDLVLPRVRGPVSAVVRVPGSKSIANRALLLAALSDGRCELGNLPDAGDTLRMIEVLRLLGIPVRQDPGVHRATIEGRGGHWPADDADLDVGDAGTVYRFITAAVCLGSGEYRIDGAARLRQRPISGLVDGLRGLGARVEYMLTDGSCPLCIDASGLAGGEARLAAGDSSQFLSALLMAAPHARGDVFIELAEPLRSRPYVDLTIGLMREFGATVISNDGDRFIVPAGQRYHAAACDVEPDASNASYFLALAALAGGRVAASGLHRSSRQGDIRMADLLGSMGCAIEDDPGGLAVTGPKDGLLRAFDVDLGDTPDLAPTLAVLAAFADAPSRIRGAPHLRHKESDRLHAIAHGLDRLGAATEMHADGLTIHPVPAARPAVIETFDDHRMAMAFTLASARTDGIVIRNADCVRKSFPTFFEVWKGACAAR